MSNNNTYRLPLREALERARSLLHTANEDAGKAIVDARRAIAELESAVRADVDNLKRAVENAPFPAEQFYERDREYLRDYLIRNILKTGAPGPEAMDATRRMVTVLGHMPPYNHPAVFSVVVDALAGIIKQTQDDILAIIETRQVLAVLEAAAREVVVWSDGREYNHQLPAWNALERALARLQDSDEATETVAMARATCVALERSVRADVVLLAERFDFANIPSDFVATNSDVFESIKTLARDVRAGRTVTSANILRANCAFYDATAHAPDLEQRDVKRSVVAAIRPAWFQTQGDAHLAIEARQVLDVLETAA